MKKIFSIFLLFIVHCSLFIAPAHAASEFTTSYISTYTIQPEGPTHVTHTIELKNNLSHIYATNYTLSTTGSQLTNIVTRDETGPLSSTASQSSDNTSIHLQIDRPAIGKDKVKTLMVDYETDDVAEVLGDTIGVNIPRLSKANEAQNYERIVKIAGFKDLPALIYPPASKTHTEGEFTVFTFLGHQNESLSLLFGESLTYKVELTYELKNSELSRIDSELALPPDTPYQHVQLQSIDPPPLDIRIDPDGNWLARYSLPPQDKLLIRATLYVRVYPLPTLYDPSQKKFIKTAHSQYWQDNAQLVKDLAGRLQTPENIYEYLVDTFTYKYSGNLTTNRQGALEALTSPHEVLCTEFTDSFVALGRTASIPTREINGYGFTKNPNLRPQGEVGDILHAWPEYLDPVKNIWISVDPTWGNTTGGVDYFHKLDFNHLTFVRHGLEDNYPLPAGAYKSRAQDRYVSVELATDIPAEASSSHIKDHVLYNTGNVALIDETVGYIPPYGHVELQNPKPLSFYDKIKELCVKLFSKFLRPRPASTSPSTSSPE